MLLRRATHVYLGRPPFASADTAIELSISVSPSAPDISGVTVSRDDISPSVAPSAQGVVATIVDRINVGVKHPASSVSPGAPDVGVVTETNPIAFSVDISVAASLPGLTVSAQPGRKTIRGTAGNGQQLYDEENNPHNTVLFDWAWFDAVGLANIVDANKHSSGQVTTDAAGNWSIDLGDSIIDIGSNGTLLISGNAVPADKQWLELPVEFV